MAASNIRICSWCKEQYYSKRINSSTCSPECRKKYKNHLNKEAYRNKKNNGPSKFIKICIICNDNFTTTKSYQKCCSEECSNTNKRILSAESQSRMNYASQSKRVEPNEEEIEIQESLAPMKKNGRLNESKFEYSKLMKKLLGEEKLKIKKPVGDRISGSEKIAKIRALAKIRDYILKLRESNDKLDKEYAKQLMLEREYIRTREKEDTRNAIIQRFDSESINGTYTLAEIGKVFGLTRERVRQLEASAEKSMKHPRVAQLLKSYTEE